MSRHPSPGPSLPPPQKLQQTPSMSSARRPRTTHPIGITAGAEDVKYQSKYKDLKWKVKEIEGDNDRLHFRVLQAKRSIQRMKLERAILYERLAAISPPDVHGDHYVHNQVPSGPGPGPLSHQPSRSISGSHQTRDVRDRPVVREREIIPLDYLRPTAESSHPTGADPDTQSSATTMDPPAIPGVTHSPHVSSMHPHSHSHPHPHPHPHSHPHSPRRNSIGHDNARHLPPLSHLQQYENAPSRSHSLPQSLAASPPTHQAHPHSTSHERGRSQSSIHPRNMQSTPQPYPNLPQQYPEHLPPMQRVLRSPPPLMDRERSLRHLEGNEYPPTINEPHMQHSRHPSQLSPRPHSLDTRSPTTRIHPHQRMGPGSYINRDDPMQRHLGLERDREREREKRDGYGEWEREQRVQDSSRNKEMNSSNMPSPHVTRRPLPLSEYSDHTHPHLHPQHPHPYQHQNIPPRLREDQGYYHDAPPPSYPPHTHPRPDTPGSGSGSGVGTTEEPSRPDSRTPFYEQQDRNRPSYRLRPVSQSNNNNDEMELVRHEDMRSQSRDPINALPPPSSLASGSGGGNGNGGGNAGPIGETGGSGGGGGNNYPPGTSGMMPSPSLPLAEPQQNRSSIEPSARKRNRNEMEIEVEGGNDVVRDGNNGNNSNNGHSGGYSVSGGAGNLQPDDWDRGSKRYRDNVHRRSVDSRETPQPPTSQDQDRDNRMSNS